MFHKLIHTVTFAIFILPHSTVSVAPAAVISLCPTLTTYCTGLAVPPQTTGFQGPAVPSGLQLYIFRLILTDLCPAHHLGITMISQRPKNFHLAIGLAQPHPQLMSHSVANRRPFWRRPSRFYKSEKENHIFAHTRVIRSLRGGDLHTENIYNIPSA
ncbi:hypothetical protein K438DRAFT_1763886 [Mycena galopus ATCC 62051]|nr:hypothetical protein K438DRAFT_1763886 [Mycena galopus ATCC 62051]